jgi:hypothetical protein
MRPRKPASISRRLLDEAAASAPHLPPAEVAGLYVASGLHAVAEAIQEFVAIARVMADEVETSTTKEDAPYSKPQAGWDIALIEESASCALFVMAAAGPPFTPSCGIGTVRRGCPTFARHDVTATTVPPAHYVTAKRRQIETFLTSEERQCTRLPVTVCRCGLVRPGQAAFGPDHAPLSWPKSVAADRGPPQSHRGHRDCRRHAAALAFPISVPSVALW